MSIYSSAEHLEKIRHTLSNYMRLPFSGDNIPGAVMEAVLATVREAEVKHTYDFVDVISKKNRCGWQIKSTKYDTPVTWKRAKIPNSAALIEKSLSSDKGLQDLGDAIIELCNHHAQESMRIYDLEQIGYARLLLHENGRVTYFERFLCSREKPALFEPRDFAWRWSESRRMGKKEQLSALHGYHKASTKKWWAWHGRGENQLHFNGEKTWWPEDRSPHAVNFSFPSAAEKLSLEQLMELLEKVDLPPS